MLPGNRTGHVEANVTWLETAGSSRRCRQQVMCVGALEEARASYEQRGGMLGVEWGAGVPSRGWTTLGVGGGAVHAHRRVDGNRAELGRARFLPPP